MRLFHRGSSASLPPSAAKGEGPLSSWQRGHEAVITAVAGTTRLAARLREIGVVPGVKLKLLRTGTRIVFQVGESRYCLRRRDAETIQVCAISSDSRPFAR